MEQKAGRYIKNLLFRSTLEGTSIAKMASLEDRSRGQMHTRSALVIVGMTLFTIGFVFTIRALPTGTEMLGDSGSSGASAPSATLLVGFVASLIGLGLATIAPAIMFMRARRVKT